MSIESYYLHYASPGSQNTCSNENVIFNKVGLSTNYPTGLPIFFSERFFGRQTVIKWRKIQNIFV